VAELDVIYVAPRHRGAGVARALLAALEAHARGAGVSVLRLRAGEPNLKRSASISPPGSYRSQPSASGSGTTQLDASKSPRVVRPQSRRQQLRIRPASHPRRPSIPPDRPSHRAPLSYPTEASIRALRQSLPRPPSWSCEFDSRHLLHSAGLGCDAAQHASEAHEGSNTAIDQSAFSQVGRTVADSLSATWTRVDIESNTSPWWATSRGPLPVAHGATHRAELSSGGLLPSWPWSCTANGCDHSRFWSGPGRPARWPRPR
jgi:Acetyltransferase (GNAT) family